jgi:membrane protein YdbS with pleckstrin-like domain
MDNGVKQLKLTDILKNVVLWIFVVLIIAGLIVAEVLTHWVIFGILAGAVLAILTALVVYGVKLNLAMMKYGVEKDKLNE